MPRMKIFLVTLAVLMLATMAHADNTLQVTAGAAIEGNFGLELQFDGSANTFFVLDESPNGETTYRASFWLQDNLSFTNCGAFCSTQFMPFASMRLPDGKTIIRFVVGRMVADDPTYGERHLYRFSVKNDFEGFLYVGGFILTGPFTRKHVTIEWQAGDPGVANGVARLYTSNDGGTPNLQGELFYQNSNWVIDRTLVGGLAGLGDQGSDAQTAGTIYFDSFESFRTLAP